jgi:chromosome partitioning protein
MPVIVFACSKGGVGKSTSANILANEMAQIGIKVAMLDADLNHPQVTWARNNESMQNLTVLRSDPNVNVPDDTPEYERSAIIEATGQYTPPERHITDEIEMLEKTNSIVIVDLEGSPDAASGEAISRADLVLVPLKGSRLDAVQAVRTIKTVQAHERKARRKIPFFLLFTQGNPALRTREAAAIMDDLSRANFPICKVQLYDRVAFRAVFSYNASIYNLNPAEVSGLPAAHRNAQDFGTEVGQILQETLYNVPARGVSGNYPVPGSAVNAAQQDNPCDDTTSTIRGAA